MTGRTRRGQPAGGRWVMGTGTGIALTAIGAILQSDAAAGSPRPEPARRGVVLMLAGRA
jgi:hypothetical protein